MAKAKKNAMVVDAPAAMETAPTPPVQEVPAIPTVDTVSEVLGVGGEVTTPIVPAPIAVSSGGKFNLSQAIKSALDRDVNMTRDDVLTFIEDTYSKTITTDFPDGTFTNTLSVIRKKLKTQDVAIAKEKEGLDPVACLKLCQTIHLTPAQMVVMIGSLQVAGSLDSILVGLAKLIELQEMLNAQSKTAQ